nr:hypothetical protein [Tanacetum cinerariifolium]
MTHLSLVVDNEEDLGELQGDSQEDKLATAMMLLDRAITQKFSTPTNNLLRTSSNTRNETVIQDGRVDIQTKNAGFGRNDNRNAGRQNKKKHLMQEVDQLRIMTVIGLFSVFHELSQIRERRMFTMKDEAKSNLNDEENDFMIDNSFGDETFEELTAVVIMMAQIQPTDENDVKEPRDDAKSICEVNASNKMITDRFHEHKNHGKSKIVINTYADDQIDSSIIFDDPYVENNGGSNDHDSNAHDPYHDVKILAYNALREAENKKRIKQ